jgi:hypothetical protein
VVFFLGDGAASWSLQKHKVVALSSCEAEYITGTVATCQAVWLAGLLGELLVVDAETPKILMDNQSAITLSKNPVLHVRSKHIKTRYHFIRECVDCGEVALDSVGTADQLADILTKLLTRVRFGELRGRIGVIKLTSH